MTPIDIKRKLEGDMNIIEADIAQTAQEMADLADKLWTDPHNWALIDQLIAMGDKVKTYKAQYQQQESVLSCFNQLYSLR